MIIVGVSFGYHDAAAVLVKNGVLVAAAEEERFSRIKHTAAFPINAIEFCLKQAMVSIDDVEAWVYYEDTYLKFDRIVYSALGKSASNRNSYLENTLKRWTHEQLLDPDDVITSSLGIAAEKISRVNHHEAHAASAFYSSSFDEAAILTMDGAGEYETTTISVGTSDVITKYQSTELPNSIGLFYSALTAFLGFRVNEGEYKVMGMAAYGEPNYYQALRKLVTLEAEGRYSLNTNFFEFLSPEDYPFKNSLIEILGEPREPESDFVLRGGENRAPKETIRQCKRFADIAASTQKVTEDIILHVSKHALTFSKSKNLCIAGGVGLNSLANAKIKKVFNCGLFVQPAAGDAGGALGAALSYHHKTAKLGRCEPLKNVYLGKSYDDTEILAELKKHHIPNWRHFDKRDKLIEETAKRLVNGKVVGVMQGRFEWGPRSLGNRSILANPTVPEMQDIVNKLIKFREPFRPFAPAVLADRADEFFELDQNLNLFSPESFMLAVKMVRPNKRNIIPAVTHNDGTARVQLVWRETNELFYDLISSFGKLTGVPILMNTSFNLQGEPIVNKPYDALQTYNWSGMDCLMIGNYLAEKHLET